MNNTSTSNQKRFIISEDWTAVWIGFLIVGLFMAGAIVPSPIYAWGDRKELATKIFGSENLVRMGVQFLVMFGFSLLATWITGKEIKPFVIVFPVLFILTTVAVILAGSKQIKSLNLEAVIFSLTVGLIVGNFFKLPDWFRTALSTEMFVKIGLVLLGTGVIFSDILKAGSLGLIQALVVVISVWYIAYWLCKKLKVDDELTMMIASSVSICGVSAAIATAGAIKGDSKKLSYVISLVLICAIPMMIIMPYIAQYFGFSQEVTGAWLGGTIDTTGAVVASGTLVGETALKISTIVKFSQNVLLGLAAFAISVYWTYSKKAKPDEVTKPTLRVIWDRFPKFVIGFMTASLLFSFVINAEVVESIKGGLKSIQTQWFVLAFTSIGLETKFKDIFNSEGQKPLYAFLLAQLFNIFITLLVALVLFG